jgi:hypothetical protein
MIQIIKGELTALIVFLVGAAIFGSCAHVCAGCSSPSQTACGVVDVVDVACDHMLVRVRGKDGVVRTVHVDLDGGADR